MGAPEPYRPLALRATNAVGGLVGRVRPMPSLDRDTIVAAARKSTGLDDLGPDTWQPGLDRLLSAMTGEARLNTVGRIAARSNVQGRLEDRLRLIDWWKQHPEVAEERITRPVFVIGLPRTGTTILYGALAASPALRSPVTWEVDIPVPPADPTTLATDPRIARMRKNYDGLRRIAPDIDRIHAVGELLPQECIAMHALEFQSLEYVVTYPVPSYFDWLREHGCRDAYAWERRMLQHMQTGYARDHWLLKSPAHLMWLDHVLEEFPDALIVQTHRDPARVLGSVSSLYVTLDNAVSDHADPLAVGRQQFDAWRWGLNRCLEVRQSVSDDRVIDVQFDDIVRDPLAVVRTIHEKFGIRYDDAAEQHVRQFLDDNSRDKHGLHTYTLADFGLDRTEVDAAFADYRAHFGVPTEE